ncbi:hypothetical protein GEMRC1_008637 [Eukaryota sp. GEM-RC1]
MTITFSYFARSASVDLVSNDCHLPKLNSGNGCLCPKGMEFNSLGECVECALNYYSSSEFNSECRSCPYPRVTLQKGSSDLDHCVCPLNTLDSVDACLPCPHLAECGYGNLTVIEPGFMLNNVTWELDECDIWFNCEKILANLLILMEIYVNIVLTIQYLPESSVLVKNIIFSKWECWLY